MNGPSADAPGTWSWADVAHILTFQAGHNTALIVAGTTLLGIAGGLVGTLALLRKRSLMSDAISHATLPGIALAFLIATSLGLSGRSLPILMLGGAATSTLAVLAIHAILRHTRLREDAAIASVLSVFFGAGVVLMTVVQSSPSGQQGGLRAYIFGQATGMSAGDVALMAAMALAAALLVALLFKELTLTCFDEDFARAAGWPVATLDLLMMALVVVVTLAGIRAVGLVLVIAMLIVPAAAARFWSDRARTVTILAGALGGLSGYLGATASALVDKAPTGAVIVLTAGAVFLASLLLAPRRGVIAALLRRARLRLDIAIDHRVLALALGSSSHPASARAGPIDMALTTLGLLRTSQGRPTLTDLGQRRARRLVLARERWERFLIAQAGVDPAHARISADLVEHTLPTPAGAAP